MNYYLKVMDALGRYFKEEDWKRLFMKGGCYWLADLLQKGIPHSYIMINRMEEHCGVFFNNGLYDVRGRIPTRFFQAAEEKDISYMKKHYHPEFDTKELERYLNASLSH
jgi:hypothetical protein